MGAVAGAGATAAFGAGHGEETMDFESMSETVAGDDDMDSMEDDNFTETEVETFDDSDEIEDEAGTDDDEGYF